MIDVSPFMPHLNQMILQGDALSQPPCWSAKFALEMYQTEQKTKAEVVTMVEESKLVLLDSYHVTESNTDTFSYNTTLTTLNQIITAFTE